MVQGKSKMPSAELTIPALSFAIALSPLLASTRSESGQESK